MPNNPTLLPDVMGVNAEKNSIPTTDNGTTGKASIKELWQSINSLPLSAGGKAVNRLDFNGLFSLLGGIDYMTQRGYTFEYDNTLPYVVGCIVIDTLDGKTYRNINDVPAGSPNPSLDPTNWVVYDIADYVGGAVRLANYSVGNTSTLPGIPAGYFLECTTGGTTGTTAPVVPQPISAGQTINDGTVTWTVRKCFTTSGGVIEGDNLYHGSNTSRLALYGGYGYGNGAYINLFGKEAMEEGELLLRADNGTNASSVNLQNNGSLLHIPNTALGVANDLGGSAVVGKSLAPNGYVKNASGFIMQWGSAGSGTATGVTFPIAFTSTPRVIAVSVGSTTVTSFGNITNVGFGMESASATAKMWMAVGY